MFLFPSTWNTSICDSCTDLNPHSSQRVFLLYRDWHFHDNIWIDSFTARYKGGKIVLSDTRFINEIETIRALKGRVVLVRRGPIPTQKEMQERDVHQSEWDWIGQRFDYEIDNSGNLEDLKIKVDDMIKHLLQDPQ